MNTRFYQILANVHLSKHKIIFYKRNEGNKIRASYISLLESTGAIRVIFETVIVTHLIETSPPFLESDGSLPHSQTSPTNTYYEADGFNQQPSTTFLRDALSYYSPPLRVGFPSSLFPLAFPTKFWNRFSYFLCLK